MHRGLLTNANTASLDERLVRCAEHNTTFYAQFPRGWDIPRALRALSEHFRQQGHRHMPFETIDLTGISLPAPDGTDARRPAGTHSLRLQRTSRGADRAFGGPAWRRR